MRYGVGRDDAESAASFELALPLDLVGDRHIQPLAMLPDLLAFGRGEQFCEQPLRALVSLDRVDGQ